MTHPTMTGSRILIVENEGIVALNIRTRLESLQYNVVAIATSSETALFQVEETRPDLVLMDIKLKGQVDGVETARQIQQQFDIPVIYLTAYADDETLHRAKLTEPYGYILKPFETLELCTAIELALHKHRVDQQIRERERWLEITLRSIGDAVITVDQMGRITFLNPAAENLTGWTMQEALGQDLEQVFRTIDDRTRRPQKNPAFQALRHGMTVDIGNHALLINRNQEETPIGDSAAPIKNDQGEVMGAVLVFRNISDLKRSELTLQRLNEELETRVHQRTEELRRANEQLQAEIAEHAKTEVALRESETRYRAIVEDQTELICRFLPDGNLTFVNDAYCRYFNKQREELLGQSFTPLIPRSDQQIPVQHFARLTRDNPVVIYEHRVILPDGHIRWQQWTDRAIFDETETLVEYQAVGRDITDRKQAEIELREALEKAQELNELKSRFITTTSHEFRTPLTIILTSSELLERTGNLWSDEKKQRYFQRIRDTIRNLTAILDDVLLINRAEAGRLEFNPQPTNVATICRDLVDEYQTSTGFSPPIQLTLSGELTNLFLDERLLRHILTNLISNAVKYSPGGGEIRVEALLNASNQSSSPTSLNILTLRVCDRGIGIPPEDLPRLFESFHRAGNVGSIPGTGLGLAIVQQCVNLYDGQVNVESQIGEGTIVTVTIPVPPSPNLS